MLGRRCSWTNTEIGHIRKDQSCAQENRYHRCPGHSFAEVVMLMSCCICGSIDVSRHWGHFHGRQSSSSICGVHFTVNYDGNDGSKPNLITLQKRLKNQSFEQGSKLPCLFENKTVDTIQRTVRGCSGGKSNAAISRSCFFFVHDEDRQHYGSTTYLSGQGGNKTLSFIFDTMTLVQ